MLERKVKGPKYQYKERAEACMALVVDLRAALEGNRAAQRTFVSEVPCGGGRRGKGTSARGQSRKLERKGVR